MLVKTAVYGGDPNWGRVLAAAGRSGVELDPRCVRSGLPATVAPSSRWYPAARRWRMTKQKPRGSSPARSAIHLDLGAGAAEATVWTSDLTHEYVTLNADYRT